MATSCVHLEPFPDRHFFQLIANFPFSPPLTVAEGESLAALECLGPVVDKDTAVLDVTISFSEVDGGLADDGPLPVGLGTGEFVDDVVLVSLELFDDGTASTDVVTPMLVTSVGMLIEVDPRISR